MKLNKRPIIIPAHGQGGYFLVEVNEAYHVRTRSEAQRLHRALLLQKGRNIVYQALVHEGVSLELARTFAFTNWSEWEEGGSV